MTMTIGRALESDFDGITLLLREAGLPTDGLREHLASGIVAHDGSSGDRSSTS